MPLHDADMTLADLVYRVIPNLNSAERLVCNTLDSLIESSTNPLDIVKRTEQRHAFHLEVHRVRLNLEHLLTRYRAEVDQLVGTEGATKGPAIRPDALEAEAIQNAIDIYRHVLAFQRGERRHPLPR